jgi:hypothetical protein
MPSSNNPPPWLDITGISRAVMKDNAQESLTNYNGNARPSELVVQQNVWDLWVGDNNGDLLLLANANGTKFYGSFYDTTNQNNDTGNVNYMAFGSTYSSYNVSVANSTELTFTYTGVYNIQFSTQFLKTGGGTSNVYIWLDKNGNSVADSATGITMSGNNDKYVAAWNFVETFAAGEYARLAWYSTDAGIDIVSPVASAPVPAIPSVIVTATQV